MLALQNRPKSPTKSINKSKNMNKQASIPVMSMKTRHFIKKICFQEAASVDMTKYGFVRDSKLQPINLMLKPLKDQLEKIIGGKNNKRNTPQSIIKQPSKKRDENRSVIFRDEKVKPSRPRKAKRSNLKISLLIKSKIKREKANKSSRKMTLV